MSSTLDREKRFTGWVNEHRGIFFKIARAYASEPADERDLRQEMFVQLWRSLPNFREQCKPSTWVYRLCLNTALTWRRGERRRNAFVGGDAGEAEPVSTEPRPSWAGERNELLAALYGAIRSLPLPERSLLVLSLDGLGYREISDITGLTENHVGVTLTRARKKLAEQLKEVRDEL